MRLLCTLFLLSAAAPAADDLMPREGSGWEGFAIGTWVKTKQTYARKGSSPTITLTTMKLEKVTAKTLRLSHVTKTALGMDDQKGEQTVPRSGEAATDEKAAPGKEAKVSMEACKRKFDCVKRTVTVTGAAGKRVITNWESAEPRVRVKRTEVYYDKDGKVTEQFTMLLVALDEERWVGSTRVRCQKYKTVRSGGPIEQRGEAFVSRDVPGGTVSMDIELIQKGLKIATWRSETVELEVK